MNRNMQWPGYLFLVSLLLGASAASAAATDPAAIASRQRERITGGEIVIGATESRATGGNVKRERVECDGGAIQLTADQAARSSVMVFRAPPPPTTDAAGHRLPAVPVTLFSLYSVIDPGSAIGQIAIDRPDRPAQPHCLTAEGRGTDLAAMDIKLTAGGVCRAALGQHAVVFQISRNARSSGGPILGRLLRL